MGYDFQLFSKVTYHFVEFTYDLELDIQAIGIGKHWSLVNCLIQISFHRNY